MYSILRLYSLFVIFGISGINAKTTYNETTTAETNESSETNGTLFDVQQYLQQKLESITDVLTQVDNSVKGLQEKAHTWAIFQHHIDAWNEQLKALEHKIELLQRSHDEQQKFGDKLIGIELTLNNVQSKVLYLSDTCYNNQQQQLQAANVAQQTQDDNILEILQDMQHHDVEDRKARSEILTRLANILHRLQKIESERCNTMSHKKRIKAAAGEDGSYKELPAARVMLPVGGCNASQRYDYNMNQSLKMMEQQLVELTSIISPKDFKQLHALTKKNTRTLDDITLTLAETDRTLENWQEMERKQSRSIQEYCQSVSGELSDYSESSDFLLKRIESIVIEVNKKLERLSRQTGSKNIDDERNEQRNDGEEETYDSVPVKNNSVIYESKAEESFDENVVEENVLDENLNSEENDTSIDSKENKKTPEINFVQPEKIGCHELVERIDGIYKLSTPEHNEDGRDFNERFCAFATDGHAWTVIQNRGPYSEQENFNRSWLDYRNGFGQLDKDFWFGTEFLHQLTYPDDYELRIEIEDFDDVDRWANYATFRLDSEGYNYNLLVSGYQGSVPDAMQYHNGIDFSTYDRRNDKSVDACCACATGYGSGWWFDNCSEANLNGVYRDTPLGHNYVGIVWDQWHGDYSLKKARMLIRPKYSSNNEIESEIPTQEINDIAEDP